jgi:hypothetical protein
MQEQVLWDEVKNILKIMTADSRSDKVKKRYKIGNYIYIWDLFQRNAKHDRE